MTHATAKRERDRETVARGRFFGGIMSTRRCIVKPDGSVLPWDPIAGCYTRCHGLSRASQLRIARQGRPRGKKSGR